MARIPPEEIERLKKEVSLVRLVEAEGIELKGQGDNLLGLCPFHEDRTPSLVISPGKNLWNCLGACQKGGDVIAWVMQARNVSFRHAVELLRAGSPSTVTAAPSKRVLPAPVEVDAEDREVLAQVVGFYHDTLKQSPEALAYLQSRGVNHPELVDHFKLGFANRSLAYRLPPMATAAGSAVRTRLQRLGVLRESGHEHFNGSLVIPIWNEHGHVLGLYGRKITSNLRKGTPLHLYLPGPHRGVFNVEALEASKTVILCEALIDALSFWCAGFRDVTASYGVGGFTADHLEAFKRFGTQQVLLAYDRDDAGDAAAQALAERLMAEGIECFRVLFPRGMDANEYARKVTPAEKSLDVLLRNAVWLGKGKPPVPSAALEGLAPNEVPAPPNAEPELVASVPAPEAPSSLAASVAAKEQAPQRPKVDVPTEVQGDDITITLGDRRYRIRGLAKNLSIEQLKVNILVSRAGAFHVDTLELYSSRQRGAYAKEAAAELKASENTIGNDLGQVLLKLEELQEEQIRKTQEPKAKEVSISEDDERAALELLRDPRLLERILADFATCGVVGEETNKLVGYLAAVSRKLEEPLAVIIQSSSAAGKTSLMEAVLSFMPEEDRVKYSAMTGQSLFYMGETDLKHKILAIVEEAGAEKASYALKLLQSEGELMIASTGKDPSTGRLVTQEYRVEGPVMIFLTTTAVEVDEELLNRCLVLTVDEEREQTRAIHRQQREKQTLEGLLARRARPAVLKVHQDAQRLLKPLLVANPYARRLTFLDDRTRTRRDHVKYLTLIRTIALLHQYQREVKTAEHRGAAVPYIEVTLEDVAVANRLAHQVLGRSLDELAPQTRRLLLALDTMVSEACESLAIEPSDFHFTRKVVREKTGWGHTQVHVHLARLVELEYVQLHRGNEGAHVYELLYDGLGKDGTPFLTGLLDVQALRDQYDGKNSGVEAKDSGPIRGGFGPLSEVIRPAAIEVSPSNGALKPASSVIGSENSHLGSVSLKPSRRNGDTGSVETSPGTH